jgi:hypothetical protein
MYSVLRGFERAKFAFGCSNFATKNESYYKICQNENIHLLLAFKIVDFGKKTRDCLFIKYSIMHTKLNKISNLECEEQ